MVIEVRPATAFEDVATIVGPRRADANACWCLSYRLPSKQNAVLGVACEKVEYPTLRLWGSS